MHSAVSETISYEIGRIVDFGKAQGSFSLTVALDENGDYSGVLIFGQGDEKAPASYGYGRSIPEVLTSMIDGCGIPQRQTMGY